MLLFGTLGGKLKKLVLAVTLLAGSMALGAGSAIKYGLSLCNVVTVKPAARENCATFVMSQWTRHNPYSLALNICLLYGGSASPQTFDCFMRAAEHITDPGAEEKAQICNQAHRDYKSKIECIHHWFVQQNARKTPDASEVDKDKKTEPAQLNR